MAISRGIISSRCREALLIMSDTCHLFNYSGVQNLCLNEKELTAEARMLDALDGSGASNSDVTLILRLEITRVRGLDLSLCHW
jgi:hypothetical protein